MRRILLIDGDRSDAGRLARVLTGLGYGLDVTFNVDEARMLNERQSYCWSVIGTPLDGIDGVELFTELRERQARIRGLLVADQPNRKTRAAAYQAGLDILPRPVDVKVLIPWLADAERTMRGLMAEPAPPHAGILPVSEGSIAELSESAIRDRLTNAGLIDVIRGVEYPFAGKDRLEMFDRDTLVRVVLLIRRWCRSRR